MNTTSIQSELLEPSEASTRPELMVSAALHLMSHFSAIQQEDTGDCVRLASVIERHLKALADLPTLEPVLRATCKQLSEHWAAVVGRAMAQPKRVNLFARLALAR
jgi:hypothetical protein